jgi:hypothetical protein
VALAPRNKKNKAWLVSSLLWTLGSLPAVASQPNSPFVDKPAFLDNKSAPPQSATCFLLDRGPGVQLKEQNPGLHQLVNQLMTQLKNEEPKGFDKLFHPRAKVKPDTGERTFAILKHRYQQDWNFSIFRVWAFFHPEKQKDIHHCEDDQSLSLVTDHGYQLQYGVWIQIMGQNELGRIYATIAPYKNRLWVTNFHIQQWTHNGQDWQSWVEAGNKALADNKRIKAYIAYDIAQKLLDGGHLIIYKIKKDIIEQRDKLFTQQKLVKAINQELDKHAIVYAGTIMTKKGTGLIVRIQLAKMIPSTEMRTRCKAIGRNLIETPWLQGKGGLRCSYILKGQPVDRDSRIGGYYFNQNDL